MRIKLFESFNTKIKDGIDDILVELKDNGFNIRKISDDDSMAIHIIKPFGQDEFEFSEIEDYVIMLLDYISAYLPEFDNDVFFAGFDSELHKIVEADSIDIVKTRLAWDEAENKDYKLRTFKIFFGTMEFKKIITESYIDDMIVSDDELKRLWNNIEDIFVELKDQRYNVSITSYNSITGLDITLRSPRVKGVSYFAPIKYEVILDYINAFEEFMTDYYSNDEVTFLYTYYDNRDRINSTYKLSEELFKKYFISKIVITVQKNNEKIIQRQKDKYKYLTESKWNSIQKIEDDLRDMFVELFDSDYDVLIAHHNDSITLSVRRDDKQEFSTGDIREYFLMAEEYFKDINKDIKIIYDGIGTRSSLPKNKLVKSIQMIVWN